MHLSSRLHATCAGAHRGTFSLAGTARKYERSVPFRFSHMTLALKVSLDEQRVRGTATFDIERIAKGANEVTLDAIDFAIQGVEVDSGRGFSQATYEYDEQTLTIQLGARFSRGAIRVRYEAEPRRGLYFLKPDDKVKDRPLQVWSQCQDEDARHWFPCHDKPHVKMTADLLFTVPSGMQVLSNGERVEPQRKAAKKKAKAKAKRGWHTVHYRMRHPLPSYLVTLVVGDFDVVVDRPAHLASGRSIPVEYWLPRGKRADGLRAFGKTKDMLELFSKLVGVEYPFDRYTQVVVSDFIFGGMENTTATTMYEHVLLDERATLDIESHDIVAHELAHQWFGDWVTPRDWPDAWLNEGFATYFEHIEREHRLGRDHYLHGLERDLRTYLGEASGRYQRAIVSREYDEPIDLFDRHLYEKGGLVLHLLRQELGDEPFWQGVREYLEDRGGKIAVTSDLKAAFERVAGRSLDRFFDEWIYRAGHPNVKAKVLWQDQHLTVQLEQTQKSAPFDLPIEIEVLTSDGKVDRWSSRMTERHHSISKKYAARPEYAGIDPNLRILGRLELEAPHAMLRSQLLSKASTRVREQAAALLAKKHDFQTLEALAKTLTDEKQPWMIRVRCAKSLGRLKGDRAFTALQQAATARSPYVRAAAAEALGEFPTDECANVLQGLMGKEPSYLVQAAATVALGKTRTKKASTLLPRQLHKPSWGDVIASAAVDACAESRGEEWEPLVRDHTRYGVPTRVRRSAVMALAKLKPDSRTRKHLTELLDDPHPHVRLSVVGALEELGDEQTRNVLSGFLTRETDGRVIRRMREALRKLGSRENQRELTDKLARLERELSELKARFATLEAKQKR